MNPITLLAFITGIGTAAPKPAPAPVASSRPDASTVDGRKLPKPSAGTIRCHRGGWDGN